MSKPADPQGLRRRSGKLRDTHINLAHGSGGKAMRDLIEDVFVGAFDNPMLAAMEDQAVFRWPIWRVTAIVWRSRPIPSSSIRCSFQAAISARWLSPERSTIWR